MLSFILINLIPYYFLCLAAVGLYFAGIWNFAGVILIIFVHPCLDNLIKSSLIKKHEKSPLNDVFILIYPLAQTLFLIYAYTNYTLAESLLDKIAIIWSTGMMSGAFGITASHEFIHRAKKFQRFLGLYLLWQVNYMHFRIEHIFGHHRYVATAKDPASAKINQSLYGFWMQSLIGSWKSSLNLKRKDTLAYLFIQITTSALIYLVLGLGGLVFWLGQSLCAILLLETINYVEHYGLSRKKVNGRYEAVAPKHSWDSDFSLTNYTLFNLGRHSHHHAQAATPFYELENPQDVPKLPMGYSAALKLAFIPPLWKKTMNPIVEKFQNF